jgi:uncharacterized protein (TIGR03000 family)
MHVVAARLFFLTLFCVGLGSVGPMFVSSPALARGAQAQSTAATTARATVTVPQEDAELEINGVALRGTGTWRSFDLPQVRANDGQPVTFLTRWRPNGYTEMTRTKTVSVRVGQTVDVDLGTETPEDRVKVIYVPTPDDVAEQMVKMAEVKPTDVVYEPGCGDARITIAAMRAGAQRAICIDIDEERARESRANVEAAGMATRIDVRHGDALDLKDLSEVTVVLLYMGDHFNLLIRPVLWRDLPVGSRIVSHRFTMGDWAPDQTLQFNSAEGGIYDLHLWTITDDVKRRLTVARAGQ